MAGIPYRNIIGSLMYAMTGTRPDIAYAIGALSQFNENPGELHWKAAKRVLRYLKGTKDFTLVYRKGQKSLEGYSDADWGANPDDRRSTTGYLFTLSGSCISWNSCKQPTVALSSTEAEYMALSQATKEAIWLKWLLEELGFHTPSQASIIHSDNQGCIALGKNPVHHARTKHIDIHHHFIRERIETGEIQVVFCGTDDMLADVLTKGLTKAKHEHFTSGMGLLQ